MKHHLKFAASGVFGTMLLAAVQISPAAADSCELGRPIKLADGNWEGIQVLNSIASKILKAGYSCDTELVKSRHGSVVCSPR